LSLSEFIDAIWVTVDIKIADVDCMVFDVDIGRVVNIGCIVDSNIEPKKNNGS
jgi:hypothetical protein